MARPKPGEISKSELVRNLVRDLPEPTSREEIKEICAAKGIVVSSSTINNALSYLPHSSTEFSSQLLAFARRLGGLKRLKKLIDLLIKLDSPKGT